MAWYDDPRIYQEGRSLSAKRSRSIQRAINSDRRLVGDRTPGWKGVPDEMSARRQADTKMAHHYDGVIARQSEDLSMRWTIKSITREDAAEMNNLWLLGRGFDEIARIFDVPRSSAYSAVRLYRNFNALPHIPEEQP